MKPRRHNIVSRRQRRARELNWLLFRLRGVEELLRSIEYGHPPNFRRPDNFNSSARIAHGRIQELIRDIEEHRDD
jgi:hypothetical protein